ncbi:MULTISPECIES: ADP-ribosylglycohydrolase family protein [Kitasatospora]|uniref:ADP-ribosylglycohydrolase family protein n=2 Tax=Streptomycetaceae TaxID=2062 RepID=A0ABY7Q8U4_9ACTN|nr:ADP-ribosylglycohydrolase family protein [Kitasatospora sp. HUAS 3-15]WBP88976.1 ADP-ribosylglycohydrolase family protein [Kitasatospora sp. HUAS 3-15]
MMTEPNGPALDALNGLSVGDALGAQFFVPETARAHFASRTEPPGPWPWTDDTEMACSVYAAQRERGSIDTFDLTHAFARRHDFDRGYGPAANRMLRLIREGGDAKALAAELFDGQGSYGNGAAMRVAPLGAVYADDPSAVVRPAADTAVITHIHPQAVDGTIAVAVAAAYAVRARTEPVTPKAFLEAVVELTPYGALRGALTEAVRLVDVPDLRTTARALGNGSRTSAVDTVPYALWCAARNLTDYRSAVWEAIGAGGDMDTVAAITGGVVAACTGTVGIPAAWMAAREPLPGWAFPEPGSVRAAPADDSYLKPLRLPRPCPVPDLVWTEEQWQRVRSGRIPGDIDGRWAFYTAEGVLYLHRSWTGFEIWRVRVAPVKGGGWRPVSALVEAYPEHYKGDHEVPEGLLRTVAGD